MAINPTTLGVGPPSISPPRISLTSDVQISTDNSKGKEKTNPRKPWADEPWPLIEPLSRTQRITHPAHHIADEICHTHNAMLRGLNALYLQAPFVRNPVDISDFLFLAQVWSGWVLDYHELKESVMIPDFEAVLGLERGALGGREDDSSARNIDEAVVEGGFNDDTDGNNAEEAGEDEETETQPQLWELPILLQNFHSYAVETHTEPLTYSPSTLRALLATLASVLVPHLHNQIGTFLQMEELSSIPPTTSPFPSLPSLPPSPAPSQPSTINTTSTPPSITPSAHSKSTGSTTAKTTAPAIPPAPPSRPPPPPPPPPFQTTPTTPKHVSTPSPHATSLTQIHLSAESAFNAQIDRYTIPPMSIRLRDIAHDGGGRKLSVPAIHAIADRLSARHAGAWRFLPCDVWGRRMGLGFLGEGEGEEG